MFDIDTEITDFNSEADQGLLTTNNTEEVITMGFFAWGGSQGSNLGSSSDWYKDNVNPAVYEGSSGPSAAQIAAKEARDARREAAKQGKKN